MTMFESRNVYLLTRKDGAGYDENAAFVVIAKSAQEARKICEPIRGDEPDGTWLNAATSKVSKIGYAADNSKSRIVLRDFRAG